MQATIDFSEYPEEVTDYAFDQLDAPGEVSGAHVNEQLANDLESGPFEPDYEQQTVTLTRNPLVDVIVMKMREKVSDIMYEVEHNERDDYTITELQELRHKLMEF